MTTLQRIQELLSHVTYKPGWSITAQQYYHNYDRELRSHFGRIEIVVTCTTIDVLDPHGKSIKLQRITSHDQWNLDQMPDKDIFQWIFAHAIREMELHEYNEWYRVDGIQVFDPHPELRQLEPK